MYVLLFPECNLPNIDNQVASVLEEAWAPEYAYIGIIVDTEAIRKLQVLSETDDDETTF